MDPHQHDSANCKDLLANISAYVDGTLREDLCVLLEEHIHSCRNCEIVVNTLQKTIDLYHEAAEKEGAIPEDVRSRLFARLELDDFIE
ncbi:MAG: zf-HC2 domain-containing protein [Anaerolineaceae bacterium]|jgi:predicted anti-sigma-YlaC factor YlaD|nr:zf-HC2 domain-containing protein [Anaerolineaceae bacterium]